MMESIDEFSNGASEVLGISSVKGDVISEGGFNVVVSISITSVFGNGEVDDVSTSGATEDEITDTGTNVDAITLFDVEIETGSSVEEEVGFVIVISVEIGIPLELALVVSIEATVVTVSGVFVIATCSFVLLFSGGLLVSATSLDSTHSAES